MCRVFVLFVFLGIITNLLAQNWIVDTIDTTVPPFADKHDISLTCTPQGHPHITYSWYFISKYANYNGIAWEYQILDTARRIETIKICLDQNNHPHLGLINPYGGYYHRDSIRIIYSYWDGANWHREVVDSFFAGNEGSIYDDNRNLDMVLNSNGIPYLTYPAANTNDSIWEVRCAYKRGNAWIIDTIWRKPLSYKTGRPRICLDTTGYPVVVFDVGRVQDTCSIYCAYFDGAIWSIERLYSVWRTGVCAFSIKVDRMNRIHLLYWSFPVVRYALKESNVWIHEALRSLSGGYLHGDMALSTDDSYSPHTVSSGSFGGFYYIYRNQTSWHYELIPGIGFGLWPSIAIDQLNFVHISCYEGGICYARRIITPGIEEDEIGGEMPAAPHNDFVVYPNPAKSVLRVRYSLPVEEKITLNLFDISGRLVKTLVNEIQKPGNYSLTLNTKSLSSGVYFLYLQTDDKRIIERLVVVK